MFQTLRITAALTVIAILAAPAQTGEIEASMRILDELRARRIALAYDEERLAEVAEDLGSRLPAPVHVDWDSLIRLGIDPRDRVSLELPPTPGDGVLASLCLVLGDEFERPVYEVHGGQLVITTIEGTRSMRVLDVYDVRDLLRDDALRAQLREAAPPPETLPDVISEPQPEASDGPDGPPPPTPTEEEGEGLDLPPLPADGGPAPSSGPAVELLDLIMDHVDPEAWFETGGTRAKMSERHGLVLVTATPTTHWLLRDALRRLRAANPASITLEASIVELPASTFARLARRYDAASASLAEAIRRDAETATLWQTTLMATIGQPLEVETSRDDVRIRLGLIPTRDATRGVLRLEVDVSTHHGADERGVRTMASLAGQRAAALIELPSATPGQPGRYLLITRQR